MSKRGSQSQIWHIDIILEDSLLQLWFEGELRKYVAIQ